MTTDERRRALNLISDLLDMADDDDNLAMIGATLSDRDNALAIVESLAQEA